MGRKVLSAALSCFVFLLLLLLGVLLPELNKPAILLRLFDAEFAKLILHAPLLYELCNTGGVICVEKHWVVNTCGEYKMAAWPHELLTRGYTLRDSLLMLSPTPH